MSPSLILRELLVRLVGNGESYARLLRTDAISGSRSASLPVISTAARSPGGTSLSSGGANRSPVRKKIPLIINLEVGDRAL